MVTLFVSGLLLLGAEPAVDSPALREVTQGVTPRLITQMDLQISAALKREALAKDLKNRGAAIRELCELHREIVSDSRLETHDKLKELRAKIWSRLVRAKTDLKKQLAKAGKPQPTEAEEEALQTATNSLAAAYSLADYSVGGSGGLVARGGAAQTEDNAQQLIELIQRTINPDSWDINGGPGSIFYYSQLQCLVIRATSEVHEGIGGVVGGLRAAGP